MKTLKFFSRHQPTTAQIEALAVALKIQATELMIDVIDHDFDNGIPTLQQYEPVAGVFPVQALAMLQSAGHPTLSTVTTARGLRVDQATADQLRIVKLSGIMPCHGLDCHNCGNAVSHEVFASSAFLPDADLVIA